MSSSRKYLPPEVLSKISRLELRARTVVEGFVSGLHKSPYHGFSVEFAEHREYAPGDDLRHIDWRVFAKSDPKETLVKEIMSDKVMYADPNQTVDECLAVMTEKRIRHLPVMDGGQMLGLVSMGDLVKTIIAEQKLTIDQLERYITG